MLFFEAGHFLLFRVSLFPAAALLPFPAQCHFPISSSGVTHSSPPVSVSPLPAVSVTVEGVEGDTAAVPCDLFPSDPKDRVNLILWYKDEDKDPIYR